MPLPKKKISRARRNNRRSHDALSAPAVANCPNCGEMKEPHRVCSHCGHYKDTSVIEVEDF